ncbi:MAG: phosphotransferase [Acidobacteriota bacterium]
MTAPVPDEINRFLLDWIGQGWQADPLYGDASTRSYFRVANSDSRRFMVAWYPPDVRSDLDRFMRSYRAISGRARVPEVFHYGSSAVAQADVGDETLFEVLNREPEKGAAIYRSAVDLLVDFQQSDPSAHGINPPFDRNKFMEELMMTEEFFVRQLMKRVEGGSERLAMYEQLCDIITHHPYVLCHRDYHGQNIHIANDQLFMIDYQDLRLGPDTYDMASLLRDRGVARLLGEAKELELLRYYFSQACPHERTEDLERRYRQTLLQRSLKILGTFANQALLRGRRHYLEFIPPTLESVRFCLSGLPLFSALPEIFPMDFQLR